MKVLDFFLFAFLAIIAACSLIVSLEPTELKRLQVEKAALEIKILQHELAAYEAMEKELKQ